MAEGRRRSSRSAGSDWLLRGLVGLIHGVEREGERLGVTVTLGIPVTLHIGGFLVSGYVISGKEYFEEFSQIAQRGLPDIFDEENKEKIAASFLRLGDQYESEEDTVEEAVALSRYNFVHLRDAIFLHPSGDPVPADGGMLWRTKLEAVDGFTLGMLIPRWGDEAESDDQADLGDEANSDE